MPRKPVIPTHDFRQMDATTIADLVEQDIKSMARQWKDDHASGAGQTDKSYYTAATATAAHYLQANPFLYMREEKEATRDAHQHWMDLMREWFLSGAGRTTK